MKLFALGLLGIALAFCGITERLQKGIEDVADKGSNSSNTSKSKDDAVSAEKAEMTSAQQAIADEATEVKWAEQEITFKLPKGWNKMDVRKESFNYGSPATGFLIASISVMASDFPSDASIKAYYQSALEQLKQGKYEKVRWLEIDGVKGVEWVEAPPEDKDGIRRFQWVAYRNYQGQNQYLNIIQSTKNTNFDKQRDAFAAILYSMKIPKG